MVRLLEKILPPDNRRHAFDSAGKETPLRDWIDMQRDLALDCPALRWEEGADLNRRVIAWVDAFAALVFELCSTHGVPTDIFQREFGALQRAPDFLTHLKEHRYYLSEVGGDVGIAATLRAVNAHIEAILLERAKLVRLHLQFPHVQGEGVSSMRPIDFPAPIRPQDTAAMPLIMTV